MAGRSLLIHPIRDVTVVTFQEASILDTLQVEQIADELYELVDGRACKKIVLDFANVRFLSSSTLGVLMTLRKKAESIKGKIFLCGLREEPLKVFKITRLDKLFKLFDNEEKALAKFGVTTGG